MEAIYTFILQDRQRAGKLARAAMLSGGWLLIAGALGAAMKNAFAAPAVLAGQAAMTTLGAMFPEVPLFWVPEGPLGYVLASLLLFGGIWLGLRVDRLGQN